MNNNTTNQNASSALNGTKTQENLRHAFEREAGTFARNSIYADQANRDGNVSAGRTFTEHAENDRRLAELWLGYLDELGDTLENLAEMSSQKGYLAEEFYEEIADIADEEGFYEIAEKMRLSGGVMGTHREMLGEQTRLLGTGRPYSEDPETTWICSSCGYTVKGNTPPESCPLCNYPVEFFRMMT